VKILLTGAEGQLGRALQAGLNKHTLIALPRAELDISDLTCVRAVIFREQPSLVLNAAAYTDVDGAEKDAAAAYAANAVGPRNLALATAELDLPILHVSSDYVFDGRAQRPYHEFDAPVPVSVYGKSKLAGEDSVRVMNPRHYIVRTAWLYSAWGHNFALRMCTQKDRDEVRAVNDQFGSPTYAPHLVSALETLLRSEAFGTYHLAGSGTASWFDLTRALYQALGARARVCAVPSSTFPHAAPRPIFSALTTLQSPRILLPPWEEGVQAFAQAFAVGNT